MYLDQVGILLYVLNQRAEVVRLAEEGELILIKTLFQGQGHIIDLDKIAAHQKLYSAQLLEQLTNVQNVEDWFQDLAPMNILAPRKISSTA